jgi:hypothetical protein
MTEIVTLSEAQMARISAFFPLSHGIPRVGDRHLISGIIFVTCNGLRWRDVSALPTCKGLRYLTVKADSLEHTAQARRLLSLSRQASEPNDLAVICGHFNVEPGSETFRVLEEAEMVELVMRGGLTSTRTSNYAKPERFANYMLINWVEAVVAFDVVQNHEVSNHCTLVLALYVNAGCKLFQKADHLRGGTLQS